MPQELTPPSAAKQRRLKLTLDFKGSLTPEQVPKMARVKAAAQQKQQALIQKIGVQYADAANPLVRKKSMEAMVAGSIRILQEGERDSRAFLNPRQRGLMHEITTLGVRELRDLLADWTRKWKAAQQRNP